MSSSVSRSESVWGLYLWGMLKDKVYNNNPCTRDNLKESIQDVASSLSPAEFQRAINSVFVKCIMSVRQSFHSNPWKPFGTETSSWLWLVTSLTVLGSLFLVLACWTLLVCMHSMTVMEDDNMLIVKICILLF